ncbi:MAG TPA: biosynthetic peptidoglycan transglycosylase [Desulfosporosinus sp.]|nr:biosynthetic peptidoglycan transglycosylase [Desulfosporosinus sp.]
MRRYLKSLFKFLLLIFVVLCISWFGLKYYFTHVNVIADDVSSDVYNQIQARHSQFLEYNDIPETYRNAIISTEDRSFFTNRGVDLSGMLRAVVVDVRGGQPLQGASTITQQLTDNTILSTMSKSLSWKVLEVIYAIGLYDTMSKQETFAFYTNVIYFGHGAYGLHEAAEIYFGKAPSELNDGEVTLLAGLPNAPSNYDPYKNMKLARERQVQVVYSMVDNGVISDAEAKTIINKPIVLR